MAAQIQHYGSGDVQQPRVARRLQLLAERMGIDPSTASTVAAATPYLVPFLKERLA